MTLEEKIARAVELKAGNKEFALFYDPGGHEGDWWAAIGNTCVHVNIGEAGGEIQTSGQTAAQAVDALISNLERQLPQSYR
jgi:hypothetical protein